MHNLYWFFSPEDSEPARVEIRIYPYYGDAFVPEVLWYKSYLPELRNTLMHLRCENLAASIALAIGKHVEAGRNPCGYHDCAGHIIFDVAGTGIMES